MRELDRDPELTFGRLIAGGREALAAGAEALCPGCGGMAGVARRLADTLGVPVVDGVEAAVKLVELFHDLGLRTSTITAYGRPRPKTRIGWPAQRSLTPPGSSPRQPRNPVRYGRRSLRMPEF